MITYYQSEKVLAHVFGYTEYIPPSDLYIGLSTQDPGVTGANKVEPTGNNYSRVAYSNDNGTTDWTAPSSGITTNALDIQFPQSSGAWGVITYFFIADAISGGNVLYYEALTSPITVEVNTTVQFLTGDLSITMINT